jgi:hypothetical protein
MKSSRNKTKPNPTNKMKKFIYILLFAFVCAGSFTSCTEEEVKPTSELENGGAGAMDRP